MFFRRESWSPLLASSLAQHAEIAVRLQSTADFVQHSTLHPTHCVHTHALANSHPCSAVENLSLPAEFSVRAQLQQKLDASLRNPASLSLPQLTTPLSIDMPIKLRTRSYCFAACAR